MTDFSIERQEAITFVRDAAGTVEAVMVGEHWRLERMGTHRSTSPSLLA